MIAVLLLLGQSVAGPPMPPALRRPVARRPCPASSDDGEVVVCSRTPGPPRLTKLPDQAVTPRLEDRLAFRLPGGGEGRVHAIQSNVGGFTGQGAAVTLKIPLGRKKK